MISHPSSDTLPSPLPEPNLSRFKCTHPSTMEPSEPTTLLSSTVEDLSPLEQDVLEEYERLAENMKKVRHQPT
jgi:hypothetical protein